MNHPRRMYAHDLVVRIYPNRLARSSCACTTCSHYIANSHNAVSCRSSPSTSFDRSCLTFCRQPGSWLMPCGKTASLLLRPEGADTRLVRGCFHKDCGTSDGDCRLAFGGGGGRPEYVRARFWRALERSLSCKRRDSVKLDCWTQTTQVRESVP